MPTVAELFKFGLIQGLRMLKQLLLLYPVNICLFLLVVILIIHRIVRKILPKSKFNKVYTPLKHEFNCTDEIRVLKKEVREVQSELIDIIKKSKKGEIEGEE